MASPAKGVDSFPTVPYQIKRICSCKAEIKGKAIKCRKCDWNYCSRRCMLENKKQHKLNCGVNLKLNMFWSANSRFFSVYGMTLKLHPDHSYVGIHLEISDSEEADVKATAVDAQSLGILLQRVAGVPRMYASGYPDCFVVVISWSGKMVTYEIELVHDGGILVGRSPAWANGIEEAQKFIVPPAAAMRLETRDQWHQGFEAQRLHRDWASWTEWKKAVAEIKKMNMQQ